MADSGIQALDREEAEYMKKHIVPNLAGPKLDPLLRAHGAICYENRGLAGPGAVPCPAVPRPSTRRPRRRVFAPILLEEVIASADGRNLGDAFSDYAH